MTETPSEPKIRIEQLTKIFGAQSEEALKLCMMVRPRTKSWNKPVAALRSLTPISPWPQVKSWWGTQDVSG